MSNYFQLVISSISAHRLFGWGGVILWFDCLFFFLINIDLLTSMSSVCIWVEILNQANIASSQIGFGLMKAVAYHPLTSPNYRVGKNLSRFSNIARIWEVSNIINNALKIFYMAGRIFIALKFMSSCAYFIRFKHIV